MKTLTLTAIRDNKSLQIIKDKYDTCNLNFMDTYICDWRSFMCSDGFSGRNYNTSIYGDSLNSTNKFFIGFSIEEIRTNDNSSIEKEFPEYARLVKKFRGKITRYEVHGKNTLHTIILFKLLRMMVNTKHGMKYVKLMDKLVTEYKIPVYKAMVFTTIYLCIKTNDPRISNGTNSLYRVLSKNYHSVGVDTLRNEVYMIKEKSSHILLYKINDLIKMTSKIKTPNINYSIFNDYGLNNYIIYPKGGCINKEALELIKKGEFKKANRLTSFLTLK